MDKFLTIPDVAEILNVSVLQVRSLLRSGELQAIQIGGRGQWRIQMSVLEEYVRSGYERTRQRVASEWSKNAEVPEAVHY